MPEAWDTFVYQQCQNDINGVTMAIFAALAVVIFFGFGVSAFALMANIARNAGIISMGFGAYETGIIRE